MIPYDDLVAALSAWRARQGLPVSTLGGGAKAQTGSGPTPAPGSGPHGAKPASGPNRGAPPPAPPRAKQPSIPPPLAAVDDALDVDDTSMLEEHYENEGDDFAMAFNAKGNPDHDGEQTSIGGAPERPTEADMGNGGGPGNRDDW